MGRRKYHALRRVAVHAGLGGAVAPTLPVVAIIGGGSVEVREGALRASSSSRSSRHSYGE